MQRALVTPLACSAVVLLLAACGSKSSTPSTVDWANNLCTAITTWKTSLDSAVSSVTSGSLSKSSVQQAADQVEKATQTFGDTLDGLGKPNTAAGAQAKQSLDDLSSKVDAQRQNIKTALSGATGLSGIIAAAPTVLDALKAMRADVSTTFKQLKSLDASGELTKAFDQASACKNLTKTS